MTSLATRDLTGVHKKGPKGHGSVREKHRKGEGNTADPSRVSIETEAARVGVVAQFGGR